MSKIALRNAWFQIHKWIGLLLAITIVPICFTGAALVWDEPLDRLINPSHHPTGRPALAPGAYIEAARGALAPGERLAELRFPADGEGAVIASAARPTTAGQGRPVRTQIWLDPATGAVLDRAGSNDGAIRIMHQIHGSLMIPGAGRQIVGWIGVAMLVSCVSGLWLWWPTVGRWARGLRWKRHHNFDTNLHHLMGFWIVLPLAVLSFTGVWISFPGVFGGGPGPQAERPRQPGGEGGPRREPGGPRGGAPADPRAMMRAQPLVTTARDPMAVIAEAGATPVTLASIAWPTDMQASWTLSIKGSGERPDQVRVDDATGEIERVRQRGPQRETTSRLMRRIHDGTGTGPVWQAIVFLGGALPTALGITGVIMWWRARQWRKDLATRRGKPRPQPAE